MLFQSVLDMVGNTPVIKIKTPEDYADVYLKLEKFNPGGSVKDRAVIGMIEKAEEWGLLTKDKVIVEPTSGNTGISLAMIGKLKGYKVIIVMPETMSIERRALIQAYGAELVLTEGAKGMKGAIEKAEQIIASGDKYFMPQQFLNLANAENHYKTTAEEIFKDIPDIDVFIAGVGTGGTISGVGKNLKEKNNKIEVIGVEPKKSPVLSGGVPGPHKIQGIGAGFVPKIYNASVVDKILTIADEEAFEGARKVAKEDGILIGISSGANVYAALKLAKEIGPGKKILTIAADGGEKYISMGLYDV